MRYYYSKNAEKHAVYHTNPDCKEGSKIVAEDRVDTDAVPPDHGVCTAC
jgi:hypothetical protein